MATMKALDEAFEDLIDVVLDYLNCEGQFERDEGGYSVWVREKDRAEFKERLLSVFQTNGLGLLPRPKTLLKLKDDEEDVSGEMVDEIIAMDMGQD